MCHTFPHTAFLQIRTNLKVFSRHFQRIWNIHIFKTKRFAVHYLIFLQLFVNLSVRVCHWSLCLWLWLGCAPAHSNISVQKKSCYVGSDNMITLSDEFMIMRQVKFLKWCHWWVSQSWGRLKGQKWSGGVRAAAQKRATQDGGENEVLKNSWSEILAGKSAVQSHKA